MEKRITRKMMIEEIERRLRIVGDEFLLENSFAARGHNKCLYAYQNLLWRLKNNYAATPHEVAAYFGKGARFDEGT